jgi:hypothetical protein
MSLAAAWPALASAAAEKAIWGPTHLPNGASAFGTYKHLGVDAYQTGLRWNDVAPQRPRTPRDPRDPAYRWPSSLDFAVAEGQRLGIRVMPVVLGTPRWANGTTDSRWAPKKDRDYADFLVAASRRYPTIKRWMIWGEPSHPSNFQPAGNPAAARRYAKLLDAAYGALKTANPRNIVIGGMTFTNGSVTPVRFLRDLRLPSGARPRLDWWGHNPFSRRFPDGRRELYKREARDINDMDVFAREIGRAYPKQQVKLWLSEFTIQSDHGSDTFNFYVSKADQAKWVTAAFRLTNRQSSIMGLGWVELLDKRPRPNRLEQNWGLMTHFASPKPAFSAYRNAP